MPDSTVGKGGAVGTKQRVVRFVVGCGLAGPCFLSVAAPASADGRKARQPTKPAPAQVYRCKKGNKTVKASSVAAAATACRGYGGLA